MTFTNDGWFQTWEMPEKTARAVQADKDKKHVTMLEKLPNGNCIVKYRGLTKEEAEDRKRQAKMAKAGH